MSTVKNEVLFIGMDIAKQVGNITSSFEKDVTKGMSSNEKEAYKFGVKNVMDVLETLLDDFRDEEGFPIPVHISGAEGQSEMFVDEIAKTVGTVEVISKD